MAFHLYDQRLAKPDGSLQQGIPTGFVLQMGRAGLQWGVPSLAGCVLPSKWVLWAHLWEGHPLWGVKGQ